jgi:hypothetical protein
MEFLWYKVIMTVISTFLICLTALYWYVLVATTGFGTEDQETETIVSVVLYILSILFLMVLGICGCVISWKEVAKCLGNVRERPPRSRVFC